MSGSFTRGLARTSLETFSAIDPNVRIGYVHLRVADLERAIGFYRDALGFQISCADLHPCRFANSLIAIGANGEMQPFEHG
jgi:catechol-2,3-dioxygenase